MLKKKTCRICGCIFYVPPKQAGRAYCDREACQIARHRKTASKERRHYKQVQKGLKTVKCRKKPDHGRRCRRCGENCYPNYFFCPECHHYVSCNQWQCDEDDVSVA